MLKLSFPTRKLKGSLIKINDKYKNLEGRTLQTYGVTNKEGIVITGKDISDDTSNYTVVSGRAFVYNPYRINVGSIGLADDNFKGIVSPAYVVFKVKEDIHPEFLLLYLKSTLGINLIKWYGDRGGVRSALRFNDLEKIDFPDLSYQQQEKALKEIEQFIKVQEEFNTEIENQANYISKLRQSILQDAIQGKLVQQDLNDEPASELLKRIKSKKEQLIKEGKIKKEKNINVDNNPKIDIPRNWSICSIQDLSLKVTDGEHATPKRSNSGYFLLSARNITNQGLKLDNVDHVEEDEFNRIRQHCNPDKNDILISCSGSVGRVCLVDKDNFYVMVRSVAMIKLHNNICPEYLVYVLKSDFLQKQIEQSSKVTAQANLFLGKIIELQIPLPPVEEQTRIVEKVDELMKLCDKLEIENNNAQKYSSDLLQSIMQKYFTMEV